MAGTSCSPLRGFAEAMYVRQLKKIQVAQSVTAGGNAPRMIGSDDVEGIESLVKYVPDGIVSSEAASAVW